MLPVNRNAKEEFYRDVPERMKILALDTSTRAGSVAITDDDAVLAESVLNIDVTHSETLLSSLKNMLDETKLGMNDIDLLALTLGPGSFTGIRIGVSTVKGFALALGKPIAGVSTLETLASNFPYASCRITPILDARKGEVYSAHFRWEGNALARLTGDRALPPEALLEEINETTLFVGDGLGRYGEMIRERLGELAVTAPSTHGFIRSSVVAALAHRQFEKGETLDPASLAPIYLRKSEAEINREKQLSKNR